MGLLGTAAFATGPALGIASLVGACGLGLGACWLALQALRGGAPALGLLGLLLGLLPVGVVLFGAATGRIGAPARPLEVPENARIVDLPDGGLM